MNQPTNGADDTLNTLHLIHQAAVARQAGDPIALDLQPLTPFADYFYICHSDSRPQSEALVDAISKSLDEAGVKGYHVEGTESYEWILVDTGDVIAHIFLTRERRDFYSLERLWADAERVSLPEVSAA